MNDQKNKLDMHDKKMQAYLSDLVNVRDKRMPQHLDGNQLEFQV